MSKGLNISRFGENYTIVKQMRGKYPPKERITLDLTYLFNSPKDPAPIQREDFEKIAPVIVKNHWKLQNSEGDCLDNGIPMLGWLNFADEITDGHINEIYQAAGALADQIDAFVSLGIGGSYLGLEATFKALSHNYWNQLDLKERGGFPQIYFLGQNMDPDYFRDTLDMLKGKRIGLNVISKSGTTTETAIAFRILRALLENMLGDEAKDYIVATTDAHKGALRKLAEEKGYKTFVVPDNIGGRFSVVSDVGLFGLAMTGVDIDSFLEGFRDMKQRTDTDDFWTNPSMLYVAARHIANTKGKKIEVIASNSANIYQLARWMEQLFPESEGHKGKGMWVSPSMYSEKLHANGQMVQQGERNILETFLKLNNFDNKLKIPRDESDADGLNYLIDKGMTLNDLNRLVIEGPAYAHYMGGVPNMTINIPERSSYHVGSLFMMLERAVAISGYLMGHNPFIQPGVEDYKRAIFALAGKPGFEAAGENIRREIDQMERMIV